MHVQSKSIFARNASDILRCLSKLPSLASKSLGSSPSVLALRYCQNGWYILSPLVDL